MTALHSNPASDEWLWAAEQSRAPKLLGLREFAEEEIRIPEGKYRGRRFRVWRQPYTGLLYDAIDSGRWQRFIVLGCVQSGKSFSGWVIPTMHHLFCYKESLISGVPTEAVAKKKWYKELRKTILASRFSDLLPAGGAGSRGGFAEEIAFRHGPTLTFTSGKGGDEKRSSDTTRVVVATETDKMDTAGQVSRETGPIHQLEARMLSYDDDQRRFYGECTVSIESGFIWTEYSNGTASRIACPCPHCSEHVTPEQEHLFGWQEAESKPAARRLGHFCCPECGGPIDDKQRIEMNRRGRLVHRGQTIDFRGRIEGEPPETDTLGFRWCAFNNLFWSIGSIAAKHWEAERNQDEEAAKKELQQFYWAKPYRPPQWDSTPLDFEQVRRRFGPREHGKGLVPEAAKYLTMAVDVGKRVCWWIAVAWLEDGSGHAVDYGTFEVASDDMDLKIALLAALRDFRDDTILPGWSTPSGAARTPNRVLIDARYQGDVIFAFCRESGARFLPAQGCGAGDQYPHRYSHPNKRSKEIKLIGLQYHVRYNSEHRNFYLNVNADHWKSFLHDRLSTPQDQPGALSLYHSTDKNEHNRLTKHLTAERAQEEFVPGRGLVVRWIRQSRANHLLDAGYNACCAGHLCGVRIVAGEQPPAAAAKTTARPRLTMPDGRPYMVTER